MSRRAQSAEKIDFLDKFLSSSSGGGGSPSQQRHHGIDLFQPDSPNIAQGILNNTSSAISNSNSATKDANVEMLDSLLHVWDELPQNNSSTPVGNTTTTSGAGGNKRKQVKKRKYSETDGLVHSTNSEAGGVGGSRSASGAIASSAASSAATPSEKNVLLCQLLSKNSVKDAASSSSLRGQSVDVSGVPQSKLPKVDKDLMQRMQHLPSSTATPYPHNNNNIDAAMAASLSRTNSDSNMKLSLRSQLMSSSSQGARSPFDAAWNDNASRGSGGADHPMFNTQSSLPGSLGGGGASANGGFLNSMLSPTPPPPPTPMSVSGFSGAMDTAAPGSAGQLIRSLSSHNLQQHQLPYPSPVAAQQQRPPSRPTSSGGGRNSDPMLSQILQQASELQRDMAASQQQQQQQNQLQTAPPGGSLMDNDSNLLSQLESVLSDSQLSELDLMLGIQPPSSVTGSDAAVSSATAASAQVSEQMAIRRIEQQLLSDLGQSASSNMVPAPQQLAPQPQPPPRFGDPNKMAAMMAAAGAAGKAGLVGGLAQQQAMMQGGFLRHSQGL